MPGKRQFLKEWRILGKSRKADGEMELGDDQQSFWCTEVKD
jgi:hypothetical protein